MLMRLSEFRENYSLHDSPINGLHFFPDQGKLILEVEICDDGSWPFLKNGLYPDPFSIELVFTAVSSYSISTGALDFENDEIDNARILSSEHAGKEVLEFLLLISPNQGTKFLRIEAESVAWDIS